MAMKAVFKILIIVAVVLAALGGFAAYLYFTDYGVEAKITDKSDNINNKWVEATTIIGGFKIKQSLDNAGFIGGLTSWNAVQDGNFIIYNIKSGHLRMWTNENSYRNGDSPLYDSA
jgi:hypothetical protein